LIVLALVVGLKGFQKTLDSFSSPYVYRKDLLQEYLLARAVRASVDPYQPIPQLTRQLGVQVPVGMLNHPTPHPPALALFCLPFAWLDYRQTALAWFVIQCLCLFASIEMLLRWWRGWASYRWSGLVTLVALGVGPAWEDLLYGQINIIQFFLFLFALRSLQKGGEVAGGLALALAVAIKFTGWPLLVVLAMRSRWKALGVAASALAAVNLLAAAVLGWNVMVDYFLRVGPEVMKLYRAYYHNWSLWGIGWRLFDGTGSTAIPNVSAPPLISAPQLAMATGLALVAGVLLAALWMARQAKGFETAYGVVICASLLVSPVMWPHYLLMLVIPLAVAALDLRALGFPRKPLLATAILALVVFFPREGTDIIAKLFTISIDEAENIHVPFFATTISFVPILATFILMLWCYRLSRAVDSFKPDRPLP
jgi:hypothetical protein